MIDSLELQEDKVFLDKLIEKLINCSDDVPVFEFKYRNIIEWITKGLGVTSILNLYKEQYEILVSFYELLCPKCNKNRINPNPAKDVLMRVDLEKSILICPKCGYERERMNLNELVICAGMRSGKTVTASFIASWIFYLCLVVGKLERRFGVIPGQRFRVSMVATAGSQTEKTVWGAFEAMLKECADVEIQNFVRKLNKEKLENFDEIKTNTKEWRIGNVEFLCLHSNSGSLAGGTGILGILEEYSRFNLGTSARSSIEVYRVIRNSLETTRKLAKNYVDDMFTSLVIVSSPLYAVNDPTLVELYGDGYWEKENVFRIGERWIDGKKLCVHKATWQFNTNFTEEDFEEEKKRDYYGVLRDFGADPRVGRNRFFEDTNIVRNNIVNGLGLVFEEYIKKEGMASFISAKCLHIGECFGRKYFVHVDLGESYNYLTMAFARLDKDDVVWVDGLLVLKPYQDYRILLETPVEIIDYLRKRVLIDYVSYDQWQSVSSIQKLMSWGIKSGKRSIGELDLYATKRLLYDGKLKIVNTGLSGNYSNGIKELIKEAESLEIVNGKIEHCDVWIGVAGAVTGAKFGLIGKKETEAKLDSMKKDIYSKFPVTTFRGRW